jgi:heme A synthase
VLHPGLAIIAAGFLIWLLESESATNRWARSAMYLVATEVALGFFNIGLSAPGWLQILHLLAAQVLWAALILACASLDRRLRHEPLPSV